MNENKLKVICMSFVLFMSSHLAYPQTESSIEGQMVMVQLNYQPVHHPRELMFKITTNDSRTLGIKVLAKCYSDSFFTNNDDNGGKSLRLDTGYHVPKYTRMPVHTASCERIFSTFQCNFFGEKNKVKVYFETPISSKIRRVTKISTIDSEGEESFFCWGTS